ncbi:MAG TPA: hypothetical protein VID47_11440 [Actinomycetota bacterium]
MLIPIGILVTLVVGAVLFEADDEPSGATTAERAIRRTEEPDGD